MKKFYADDVLQINVFYSLEENIEFSFRYIIDDKT